MYINFLFSKQERHGNVIIRVTAIYLCKQTIRLRDDRLYM